MSTPTEQSETETRTLDSSTGTSRERRIGHDEFDPVGTLVLITLYFFALALMWAFTYFVEFLGNEPTPISLVW